MNAKSSMKTPDWNQNDLAICQKYDEKVKQGQMSYRTVKVK